MAFIDTEQHARQRLYHARYRLRKKMGLGPAVRGRPLKCNDAFTGPLIPIDYYWLGFIAGDGGIQRDGYQLQINLAARDREHLITFANFMKCRQPSPKGKAYRVAIGSRILCQRLRGYGITPQKTFTLRVTEDLACSRHFWRGFFDADGHLRWKGPSGTPRYKSQYKRHPSCGLNKGSRAIMEQFTDYIERVLGIAGRLYFHGNSWNVAWTGRKAAAIIRHLYEDADYALARKLELAQAMMAECTQ